MLSPNSRLLCRGTCNRLTLELHLADIFTLGAESVVNPANRLLSNAGGLASQIATLAGPSYISACEKYIYRNHFLTTGTVFTTESFDLASKNIKKIINVVGPIIENKRVSSEQSMQLKRTVQSCIVEASGLSVDSLALPAISCGIYGFPIEPGGVCHIEGFLYAAESLKNKSSSLRTVKIALFQDQDAEAFLNAFILNINKFQSVDYFGNPKTWGGEKFQYCGGCSNLYKKKFFSLLPCCKSYCNFCVCRYKLEICLTCKSELVMGDIMDSIWCRECFVEVPLTKRTKETICKSCRSICSFHYNPSGSCLYCKSSYTT